MVSINELAKEQLQVNSCIIVCSALKESYRTILSTNIEQNTKWVFLHGSFHQIKERMNNRKSHFMSADLLKSQFDILEEPTKAITININLCPTEITENVINKLQKKSDRNVTINGFPAKAIETEQVDEKGAVVLNITSYLIQDGSTIYMFYGLAEPASYNTYKNLFRNTMEGFEKLTDRDKIAVKPDRIHIESINSPTTLSGALRNAGVKSDRFEEMAIVNGMQLTDQLKRGQLIKVLKK